MVLGVRTDGFCAKTVTLRYLRCAGAIWTWLQDASVLCWGKSRNPFVDPFVSYKKRAEEVNMYNFNRKKNKNIYLHFISTNVLV